MLKKKGMKTTGKKATLMKRLHMRGGATKAERDAAIAAAKALPEGPEKVAALAAAEAMMEEEEPPKDPNAMGQEEGGRRRRRSRRREGGKRRSRRTKLNLDMYTRPTY
jgi:hypothetical protein